MRNKQQALGEVKVADQKGRITLGNRYAGRRFAVREEPDGTAILTPVLVVPESDHPLTSQSLDESFTELEDLVDNWDGHGSPAPTPSLIGYAREVLALLQAGAVARGLRWRHPHIGSNERGQITLEWWDGPRTLTVFVRAEDRVDYLKSWGSDIVSEMEDGELNRLGDFASLSGWLFAEGAQAA